MRNLDELRPLTVGQLLALWRDCREIADPLERVLLCNGRILARCCFFRGKPVYQDAEDALEDLTARQVETLLLRLAEGGGPSGHFSGESRGIENPAFDAAQFQALQGEERT